MDDWDKFQYEENKTVYTDTAEAPKRAPKEKKEPVYVTRKAFAVTLIICMVISAAVGAGAYALAMSHFGGAVIDKTITTTNYNLAQATGSELSVQEIIAKNENSVVAISTESVATDTWLRQYVTKGAGSGVIYSEDGYIITNNHVIEDASTIEVTLYDGSSYDATLVASDEQTDLAVIKIDQKGLTPVTIGTMDNLNVGDLVVAIGNPLGTLSGTATEGIISALEREITLDGKTMTLIQTSASINPGNSGGGLFDQFGNLIGIVVAKSSGSDVEGLGFAIPCDPVSDQVRVFEAPIDLMSYCTLHRSCCNAVALCGLYDGALRTYLRNNPQIKRIVLCLDMDTPGEETAEQLRKKYAEMGYEISQEKPRIGKDWNEYLQKGKHWK